MGPWSAGGCASRRSARSGSRHWSTSSSCAASSSPTQSVTALAWPLLGALPLAELASVLVPALAATDLETLAEALGVAYRDNHPLRTVADALADVFEALLVRIAGYDDVTLERLATHVSEGGWHFAELFEPRFAARFRPSGHPRLMPPEIAFLRERPREDALEPTGSLEPVDLRVVQEVIGPRGTLSVVIAGFERRRQQEEMADAVAEAINVNGQILVEAGTGTGKSWPTSCPPPCPRLSEARPLSYPPTPWRSKTSSCGKMCRT